MLARALVLLNAAHVPAHERDGGLFETAEFVGEGPDWESAKNACVVPDGAVMLAWIREE